VRSARVRSSPVASSARRVEPPRTARRTVLPRPGLGERPAPEAEGVRRQPGTGDVRPQGRRLALDIRAREAVDTDEAERRLGAARATPRRPRARAAPPEDERRCDGDQGPQGLLCRTPPRVNARRSAPGARERDRAASPGREEGGAGRSLCTADRPGAAGREERAGTGRSLGSPGGVDGARPSQEASAGPGAR
jgi:hypothetical protein